MFKPSQSGSSVGIHIVTDAKSYEKACLESFRYSDTLLVDRYIQGRELTVSILGDQALPVVEVNSKRAFYDYQAKYLDKSTELLVPAPLDPAQVVEAQRLALEAVRVLEGSGFARVDFLLDKQSGEFFVNEVNSITGFTEHSMFP